MDIPKDVVDKKKYLQYKALKKHPILNEDKIHIASDGTEVNLAAFPNVIKKWTEHLSLKEQSSIINLKQTYYEVNNKLTVLKRNAYGLKQGFQKGTVGKSSITSLRKVELLEYFGRMFTTEEVVKIINEEWAIPVQIKEIHKFRVKYSEEIKAAQEKFRASHSDIRLGVKRSRLDELTFLYGRAKEKYVDKGTNELHKLCLSTLEQIRKEAEGDRLTIDGKIDVTYENNIQEHLRQEVFRTLNLKEIILSRVSARMNVNPVKLIHSLNASYYKKFSNVLGDFNPEDKDDLAFPSQMNYDFERIGKAQSMWDRLAEDAVVEDDKVNNRKDLDKGESLRDMLLAKLKQKAGNLKATTGTMEANVDR